MATQADATQVVSEWEEDDFYVGGDGYSAADIFDAGACTGRFISDCECVFTHKRARRHTRQGQYIELPLKREPHLLSDLPLQVFYLVAQ